MDFKQIDKAPKTFILIFNTGDELAKGLSQFADEQKLSAASFKAVGALSSVRLAWFNWESKKYEPSVTLDEQVELLSLIGTVPPTAVIFSKRTSAQPARWYSRRVRPTFKSMSTQTPVSL